MNNCEIECSINVIPPNLTYFANENELSIIITNFIDNAIDAIRKEEPVEKNISIEANISPEGDTLQINVTDSANSLKEDLEGLLVPFYSTKTSGKFLGMGLSLSQYIANLYNGGITVGSKNDRTVFTLTLPIENID